VRDIWKLREYPIPNITLALENSGIPVVNIPIMSDKQDGFLFRSPVLNRLFVGINTCESSAARVRYDAAHELGHAILHKNVKRQSLRESVSHTIIEQQAHRFAGAFIFPRRAFFSEVRHPTLDYFSSLKKKWGLSIAAMIYRSYDLGLIDEEERKVLYRNMTRRGWRGALREPFDDPSHMPVEQPRMLRRGVEVILRDGIMDRSTIVSGLSLPETEIEQLVGLEQDFFKDASVEQFVLSKREPLKTMDFESGTVIEFPQRRK
jgi:Zn-dependent peptidase ImmA (M78 family)